MSNLTTCLLIIFSLILSWRYGLVKFGLAFVGFVSGLIVSTAFSQIIVNNVKGLGLQVGLSVTVVAAISVGFAIVGSRIGQKLKMRLLDTGLYKFDRYSAPVLGLVAPLILIWFVGWFLIYMPVTSVQRQIQSSIIFAVLYQKMPQKPSFITTSGKYLYSQHPTTHLTRDFYVVKETNDPITDDLVALGKQHMDSIVKVSGDGGSSCPSGKYIGTGFVISPGIIVTNSHVVGGLPNPKITDKNGTYPATPILFDRKHDIAVLRSYLIKAPPLKIAYDNAKAGDTGVVVGFPGGGELTFTKAKYGNQVPGKTHDLFKGFAPDSVYEMTAETIPGNSGSPVLSRDGKVRSIIYGGSGQITGAMPTNQITELLESAPTKLLTANTQTCINFHNVLGQ